MKKITTKIEFLIALVTAPDRKTARRLAYASLQARLVACANIIPGIKSHYWWQGKIDDGSEVLILFKTSSHHVAALEELIVRLHPYDTPEFVVIDLAQGNHRYLDWWQRCLAPPGRS